MEISGLDNLVKITDKIADPNVIREAVLMLFTDYHARIFEMGMASDGNEIGQYSKKPIYINPDNSPKSFSPKGKNGKTKFDNGKPHKTRYFSGGYLQFKSEIKDVSGIVNLQLTENLKRHTLPEVTTGRMVYGFANPTEGLKASGNEAHFKKRIFDLSNAEMNKLPLYVSKALKKRGL